MIVERTLAGRIRQVSRAFPAVLVSGPRGAGKTALLKACAGAGCDCVSLDDPENRRLANENPLLFLRRHRPPVFIDEVQHAAPRLFPYIKAAVDEARRPGMFWLASSLLYQFMPLTESLCGRVALLRLQGLSRSEQDGLPDCGPFMPDGVEDRAASASPADETALFERVWHGSYPARLGAGDADWLVWHQWLVQSLVGHDVRDFWPDADPAGFVAFIKAAAERTGQALDMADLARASGISVSRAEAWLNMLKALCLVEVVSPLHAGDARHVHAPRLYFLDTGLACSLAGITSPEALRQGPMRQAMLETWVVSELLKSWWHSGKEPPLYSHYDASGRAVPLVLTLNGLVHPIWISQKERPAAEDMGSIDVTRGYLPGAPRGRGVVLCMAREPYQVTEDVVGVPLGWV
ncbi:MAG: ATP-binding protein [Desulfovibrionaceae bacterium]|nr:ATP-binding protein [Desulfovibrionaceae bacterium]